MLWTIISREITANILDCLSQANFGVACKPKLAIQITQFVKQLADVTVNLDCVCGAYPEYDGCISKRFP